MATEETAAVTGRHVHGERSPLRPAERVAAVAG